MNYTDFLEQRVKQLENEKEELVSILREGEPLERVGNIGIIANTEAHTLPRVLSLYECGSLTVLRAAGMKIGIRIVMRGDPTYNQHFFVEDTTVLSVANKKFIVAHLYRRFLEELYRTPLSG